MSIEEQIESLERALDMINELEELGNSGDAMMKKYVIMELQRLKRLIRGRGLVSSKTLIPAIKIDKKDELWNYSNPITVQKNAFEILGENAMVYQSVRKGKKYMIWNPNTDKWVYFGAMGYEDYTKHKDDDRRRRYRARAENIRGDWIQDEYSPNSLSIHLLW
jgi:hypothetical protein